MEWRLAQQDAARHRKEFTRMISRLLRFHMEGGTDMQKTATHFEQVPLETVHVIVKAEKQRLLESETPKPSNGQRKPQSRVERKG
jgi:hypothetical protein